MMPLSGFHTGPSVPARVRFGEQYGKVKVSDAYAGASGDLVRPVNAEMTNGSIIPLMTELRPSQADMLAGVNTRLDTLNTTVQQGFSQLAAALNNRFNAL